MSFSFKIRYFCTMKKRTIWSIAIAMGIALAALIGTQFYYLSEVVETRRKQFDENVKRALYQAARNLELKEVQNNIETAILSSDAKMHQKASAAKAAEAMKRVEVDSSSEVSRTAYPTPIRFADNAPLSSAMNEQVRQRLLHQKGLLNAVVYQTLYLSSERPIEQRVKRTDVDNALKAELQHNGIDLRRLGYHFRVLTVDGREVVRCPDFSTTSDDAIYREPIFNNDSPAHMGFVEVRFPGANAYIWSSTKFVLPSIGFSFMVLGIFVFTIYSIFRQKKLSQMKTDFINNMTHELKTPIASISLVSQMLSDDSLHFDDAALKRNYKVIHDEAKRLRLLVEKVLQLSMFDNAQAANFKFDELDADSLVAEVASTFQLKVEAAGGKLETKLEAEDPIILADSMHFTNLINNLLENALKYSRPDVPPHLVVSTRNEGTALKISIADNGLGIKKEDLKRIFERFYRVHTGNVHNVRGVGIGLAYVAGVVKAHNGTIVAESEYGKGTTFTITIPLLEP